MLRKLRLGRKNGFLIEKPCVFPSFICANNSGSLVNSLFGGKMFSLVSVFCIFCFQVIDFLLSRIVFPAEILNTDLQFLYLIC